MNTEYVNLPLSDGALTHYLLNLLNRSVITISFTKADGSVRKMKCTLLNEYIKDKSLRTVKDALVNEKPHKSKPDVFVVWDIEKDAWRSFKLESLLSIDGLEIERKNDE